MPSSCGGLDESSGDSAPVDCDLAFASTFAHTFSPLFLALAALVESLPT
nr:MAG TPA: hypothetical protein [Caudoviricetes sp.]